MFDNSELMAMVLSDKNHLEVYRLPIDRDVQKSIADVFSKSVNKMRMNKQAQKFSASYKLEDDEYFKIENFIIQNEILDAIRSPMGVMQYSKMRFDENGNIIKFDEPDEKASNVNYPDIKAVFMGERIEKNHSEVFNVAFQKIRREQHLTQNKYNLFFDHDAFHVDKRFGIGISDLVDCYFAGDELDFSSFYYASRYLI